MYSIVEVTIKRGEQTLLDLLKDNPTRAVMQDNFSAFSTTCRLVVISHLSA